MVLAPKLVAVQSSIPGHRPRGSPRRRRGAPNWSPPGSTPVFTSARSIQRDMVAVRGVSQSARWPSWVQAGVPRGASQAEISARSPRTTDASTCAPAPRGAVRLGVGSLGDSSGDAVVDVTGPLIVDDADLMIQAAVDGPGLTFSIEEYVASQIASGALVRVLEAVTPFARVFPLLPRAGGSSRPRCPR